MLNAPAPLPIALDETRLLSWFQRPDLVAPDGRILSWLDRHSSGYGYDEATALVVRLYDWLGWSDRGDALREVVQKRLDSHDWLQRNGLTWPLGPYHHFLILGVVFPCKAPRAVV